MPQPGEGCRDSSPGARFTLQSGRLQPCKRPISERETILAALEDPAAELAEESTRSGAMPCVELGRYRRYVRADVAAWLGECKEPGRPIWVSPAASLARHVSAAVARPPLRSLLPPCPDLPTTTGAQPRYPHRAAGTRERPPYAYGCPIPGGRSIGAHSDSRRQPRNGGPSSRRAQPKTASLSASG